MLKTIVLVAAVLGQCLASPKGARIVGGSTATIEGNNFNVAVESLGATFKCSGIVITKDHILTTAQCVGASSATALKIRHSTADSLKQGKVVNVAKVTANPDAGPLDNSLWFSNLAILTLASSLTLTEQVGIIEIAEENIQLGSETFVTGWGIYEDNNPEVSAQLQSLRVHVKSCSTSVFPNIVTTQMFCAGDDDVGACSKDEGSPLVDRTEKPILVGVASLTGCNTNYTVFSYPGQFRSWIDSVTEGQASWVPLP